MIKNVQGPMGGHKVIGSDHVVEKGGQLIVHTLVDMSEWQVRTYRRPRIVFENQSYYVVRKDTPAAGRIRYVLEPWSDEFNDLPGKSILYDEAYVLQRDSAITTTRKAERLSLLLLPFKPLIGFLSSETKLELERRYGISSRSATSFSLKLQGFVILMCGLLVTIMVFAGFFSFALSGNIRDILPNGLLTLIIFILTADLVVRYGSLLKEEISPPGFYEWLFRRKRQK